jgi:hypothetical protein
VSLYGVIVALDSAGKQVAAPNQRAKRQGPQANLSIFAA